MMKFHINSKEKQNNPQIPYNLGEDPHVNIQVW